MRNNEVLNPLSPQQRLFVLKALELDMTGGKEPVNAYAVSAELDWLIHIDELEGFLAVLGRYGVLYNLTRGSSDYNLTFRLAPSIR